MKPVLLIITGPPGAGKTTLAGELAQRLLLPVVGKDQIKELLFDTLGCKDRAWSQQLGRASIELLYQFVQAQLAARRSCIVESNFRANLDTPRFLSLQERHPFSAVQINCFADRATLAARYKLRATSGQRHPGHCDLDGFDPALVQGRQEPLCLGGPIIEWNTTNFATVDYVALASEVKRMIDG